jgi:CheY-like chemotaxis protein
VTADEARRDNLHSALGARDLEVIDVTSGGAALTIVREQYLDGLVIDLRLDDIPATQLVEEVQKEIASYTPPVILYSKRNPTSEEMAEMRRLSRVSVVKHAQSAERLLYETALLLHRLDASLSEQQRDTLAQVHRNDETLSGRRVLVVDDDLRNIFALTSVLEQHNLRVVHAENGRAGVELLKSTPGIDIVLMDIMMPEMDGYQTTRAIRQIPGFRDLPIIALTAKAMKGDREKCIEAGASDYVPKPVDLDQLFSVMRVWLARGYEIVQTTSVGLTA